jgi:Zn-dependent protease with chaperone function
MQLAAVLAQPMADIVIALFFPGAIMLCFRLSALLQPERSRKAVWVKHRQATRFLMAVSLAAWWAAWDLFSLGNSLSARLPHLSIESGTELAQGLLFCVPPLAAVGTALVLAYSSDAAFLGLKWTVVDFSKLVFWRLMNFSIPLLMVALGFDDLWNGKLPGSLWICIAGIAAVAGTVGLRRAEGIRLHQVKASETRNRALAMARRMGVNLRRVYVVPAGRGHLTNAFGGGASIGLTDNLGKYFNKAQTEFVIAHELAHVQKKHGRKKYLLTISIFAVIAIALFTLRARLAAIRPLVDVLIVFIPLVVSYSFSRSCEYEADRIAVEVTNDPDSGIRAITRLYRVSDAPVRPGRLTELFQTHPSLFRRVEAIGRAASFPADRVTRTFEQALGGVTPD